MLYYAKINVAYKMRYFLMKGGCAMRYYPRLREDADLTQEALVKLLHMHKTTYTNYEQGKREPPFELIIRLAELYNVSIDYIAGIISEPRPPQR